MLALLAGAAAALAAIVAQRAPTLRWFADSSERAGRGPHNPARSVRVTVLKLGVLLVGLGAKVADSWPGLLSAYQLDAAALLEASARLIEALLFRAAAVLLALGAIELGVQQLARLRRLRMTRAEVKEEQRELLGDPQMLAERRARAARSMERLSPQLRAAAISQLSAAALLLTGDNRVVALRYAPGQDEVPIVWLKADGAHAIELVQRAYSLDLELATEPQLVDELSRLALLAPIPTAWHERVAQLLVRAKGAAS
jgi:type III secretory pathway component EscU